MTINLIKNYLHYVYVWYNGSMKKNMHYSCGAVVLSKSIYLVGGLVFAMLCSGIIAGSIRVSADNPATASATASVTVSSACSMTYNNSSAHTVSMINNSTEENVGVTTLTATCNDAGGLAIYAIGYSGDEYGNTNMIGTTGNIATGTSDSTSNWSMRLYTATGSITPSSITSTFTAVPSTYTKFAELSSGTTGSSALAVNATYRFHISATQPADTYTGKVKYTMVHPSTEIPLAPQPSTAGCINYFANASTALGTMGCQSVADGDTVDLLVSNFSREGYGFAGWSDAYDYATNPNANLYGPQEQFTVPTGTTTNGLSLYAIWVKSAGSLQNSSTVATVCGGLTQAGSNKTLNSVSALTDQRDNQTYAIAKLADGSCWMIENLRLGNTATGNTDGSLAQGYNSSFAGLANPESPSRFSGSTTANSIYSIDGSTNKTISGNNQSSRFPRYNNANTPTNVSDRPNNPTTNDASNENSDAGMYIYGNYYTWAAAIADTTAYTSSDANVASTSICPAGWHLPMGGSKSNESNNDYWSLIVTGINGGANPANYSSSSTPYFNGATEAGPISNALRSYPNNFVYAGYPYNTGNSISSRGQFAYYWSSTALSADYAHALFFSSSNVRPGNLNYPKYNGRVIRCLASSS